MSLTTIPGVCTVETFGEGAPRLLIEVPHGADEQSHYDDLVAQLTGSLPRDLHKFFWVNTDVAAYAIGRAIAERSPVPAVVLRSLIPRTLIDVNRVLDESTEGMTPGLQPYVTEPSDQALLTGLHRAYTEQADKLYRAVCADGFAVIPHTYAPRTVPITDIDEHIVEALERYYTPGTIEECALRPELDVITTTPRGHMLAPRSVIGPLMQGLREAGFDPHHGGSYTLHPATMGAHWSKLFPGRVLCFEARRDLVTHWIPFAPKALQPEAIEAIAQCTVDALRPLLTG